MYVHSNPSDTRNEADQAVKALGYKGDYCVDADHINLGNVESFIASSDFFTIDVASKIGIPAPAEDTASFIFSCAAYTGELNIPNITHPFHVNYALLKKIADKFLTAITEAGKIYRFISEHKG